MNEHRSLKAYIFFILLLLSSGKLVSSETENANTLAKQVEGLWLYTALITSEGKDLPLNGIFLFKNDVFLQYAAFENDPIEDQGAMAHAGPYYAGKEYVNLTAEQTLSTAPLQSQVMNSRGLTKHHATVSRIGKGLTLIFSRGTGTVQKLERIGDGLGEIHKLENGMLALVDGYFILVNGNGSGIDSGYGTYHKEQNSIRLDIKRWTNADPSNATNLYDTKMRAHFDGQALLLEDGQSFRVTS